jgi:hypothetical protein
MNRTKWMRLKVRNLSEVVRWAGDQNARHIDNFRYRVLHGRESVSFRMIPNYAIEVGTTEIVVVCQVRVSAARLLVERMVVKGRRMLRRLKARQATPAIAVGPGAEILPWAGARSTSLS